MRPQKEEDKREAVLTFSTMLFLKTLAIFWFTAVCVQATAQLVVLKASETLDSFMRYDTTYPVSQRAKDFIGKSFKIGNFHGFSGNFSAGVLERLLRCPMVEQVTEDIVFEALEVVEQRNAPRHLSNVSNRKKKLNRRRTSYYYDQAGDGEGVNAYIIDLGIATGHRQFEGRCRFGKDFTGEGSGDGNGHGTHVAGLVGSDTYGVSKAVELWEVKALNSAGQGTLSDILASLEFAVEHRKQSLKPGVANLSLGALRNEVLNHAVNAASETGLVVVVAAGNSDLDACEALPASARLAITVGAVDDSTNGMALFLNWGPCVDIFAGGVAIPSVDIKRRWSPLVLTGTLMASPIITGMTANLLSAGVSSFDVKNRLLAAAVRDSIPEDSFRGRSSTPNVVVYNGLDPDDRAVTDDEMSDETFDSDTEN